MGAERGKGEAEPREALTPEDIAEYLASVDDFALERQVYSIAKGLRFSVEHAALYTDPVTAKPRQFDVRASFGLNGSRISLAIECKSLRKDFPLLVSCVPREFDECVHEYVHAHSVVGSGASFARVEMRARPHEPCMYPVGEPVGKSMRQVKREPATKNTPSRMVAGDNLFDKWMQALSSLGEMIAAGAAQLAPGISFAPVRKIAFVPVLVVPDQTLWLAEYSSTGTLLREPYQGNGTTFYLGRKYWLDREQVTFTVSHLHIMTRTEIGSWLSLIANAGGVWETLLG